MTKMIPVSDKTYAGLEAALAEMEREFIMFTFRYDAPKGEYQNEIGGIPGVGMLTVSPTRDQIFFQKARLGILDLQRLMKRERDYVTTKRVAAIRQRYFVKMHRNRIINRGRTKQWSKKSGEFCAGKFLLAVFDKHISLLERKG